MAKLLANGVMLTTKLNIHFIHKHFLLFTLLVVDLKSPKGKIEKLHNGYNGRADCTLTLSDSDMLDMVIFKFNNFL